MNRSIFTCAVQLTAIAAAALMSTSALALDFGGYFRAGPGATKKDAARACYGLSGAGLKYRLGNECDIYGEFMFSQGFTKEGVEYKASLMTDVYNGGTDTPRGNFGIAQLFVEGKGFDIAPEANFWIGKRYYRLGDVHIVDTNFTKLDGVGGGVNNVGAGAAKLGFSYWKTDGSANQPGNRFNAEAYDIASNPGGKLRFVGSYVKGDFGGAKGGVGLLAQHNQDNFLGLGGGNTLWVSATTGSAGLDGNFGDLNAASKARGFRIVESFTWQLGAFGGQAMALWQNDKDGAGVKTNSTSLGARASYALTKHFKFVTEAGYSQKKPDNSPTQKLAKLTLAPTLSTGPGFWNRPELRVYVTTAKWNAAANAAAGAGGVTGIGDGKTTGTSYGAQVEIWY